MTLVGQINNQKQSAGVLLYVKEDIPSNFTAKNKIYLEHFCVDKNLRNNWQLLHLLLDTHRNMTDDLVMKNERILFKTTVTDEIPLKGFWIDNIYKIIHIQCVFIWSPSKNDRQSSAKPSAFSGKHFPTAKGLFHKGHPNKIIEITVLNSKLQVLMF